MQIKIARRAVGESKYAYCLIGAEEDREMVKAMQEKFDWELFGKTCEAKRKVKMCATKGHYMKEMDMQKTHNEEYMKMRSDVELQNRTVMLFGAGWGRGCRKAYQHRICEETG